VWKTGTKQEILFTRPPENPARCYNFPEACHLHACVPLVLVVTGEAALTQPGYAAWLQRSVLVFVILVTLPYCSVYKPSPYISRTQVFELQK